MNNYINKIKLKKSISIILFIVQFLNFNFLYSIKDVYAKEVTNQKVRLEDDFYSAINKEWMDSVDLADGNVSYGTFEELYSKVNCDINNIIVNIQKNKNSYLKNSDELKVLNLYNNFLNLSERNKDGIRPIEPYIQKIDSIKNIDDFRELVSQYDFSYFNPLINIGVGADYKNSKVNILYIGHSGLGLGNSLYYKDKSDKSEKIRKTYLSYIKKLNILSGKSEDEAEKSAKDFFEIENTLAASIPTYQESAEDEDKISKCYNVYNISQLSDFTSNIDFVNFLCKFNVENAHKIVVDNPENIKLVDSLITEENIPMLKNYLKNCVLLNSSEYLSDSFRQASNGLKEILYGGESGEINRGSAVKFASGHLNGIVSRLYVETYFDKECKQDVEKLVYEIIDNFKDRINKNSWMSEETKKKALNKLKNINVKVGYPDKWYDYRNINIKSYEEGGSLIENVINIYSEECKKQCAYINNSVDKSLWNMGTFAVNAYYNPLNNEIVFPAAILQAPFYDKDASKEKNLGGIGAVIGHELTHAFDNVGAQFDENGKLKNWWTENDYKEFTKRSKKVVDYYSNIEVDKGNHVNGFLTVGENISDLGGVACVIDIAKKLDNPNLKELFENYATIWREVSTKEFREYLLKNDPHSPKKVRVNGVLSQFEDFYSTYGIKEGDKMYVKPENRVGIW